MYPHVVLNYHVYQNAINLAILVSHKIVRHKKRQYLYKYVQGLSIK